MCVVLGTLCGTSIVCNVSGIQYGTVFSLVLSLNRKFGVELTAGMGSVQLLLFRNINILEKEINKKNTIPVKV